MKEKLRVAIEKNSTLLSAYKSCSELPLFLNVATAAKVLGVSPSSGCKLMHDQIFLFSKSAAGS